MSSLRIEGNGMKDFMACEEVMGKLEGWDGNGGGEVGKGLEDLFV